MGAANGYVNTIDVYIGGSATKATVNATGLYAADVQINGSSNLGTFTVGSGTGFAGVTVVDQNGNPFGGATVTFSISGGGGDGDVNMEGQQAVLTTASDGGVAPSQWDLGTTVGVNTLTASIGATSATVTATGIPDVAAQIAIAGGQGQTGVVNSTLTNQLSVTITDRFGNSVSDATVTAVVSLEGTEVGIFSIPEASNAEGLISRPFQLSTTAGVYTIDVFIEDTSTSTIFTATAVAGAAADILRAVDSDIGTFSAGTSVGLVSVTVVDSFGNSVSGATVTFAANNSGSLTFTTVITGVSGLAATSWTLGNVAGTNTLSAYISGTSTNVTFTATGLANGPQPNRVSANPTATVGTAITTPLTFTVSDSFGNALANWTVTLSTAGAASGAVIATTTLVSDANGTATIPAGSWTLGTLAGNYVLTATAAGGTAVTLFTATASADSPVTISAAVATDRGTATVGTSIGAISVTVVDQYGNAVSGQVVTLAISGGGGDGAVSSTSPTSVNGLSTVVQWTLGSTVGTNTAVVFIAGTSTQVTFTAVGTVSAPVILEYAGSSTFGTATVVTNVGALSVTVTDEFEIQFLAQP